MCDYLESTVDDMVALGRGEKLTRLWMRWSDKSKRPRWFNIGPMVAGYVYHRREGMHFRLSGHIDLALRHEDVAERLMTAMRSV